MKEYRLCYVSGFAYFTTQDIKTQWGDDWDDAPYEHNAGTPYEWHERVDSEKSAWEIIKVAYSGDLETPSDIAGLNSSYSVQRINSGAIAWLASSRWGNSKEIVSIVAGTTLEQFIELVEFAGGEVYLPRNLVQFFNKG